MGADSPIEQAAARLATGKWLNGGQTDIAADYVVVDHARRDALVVALREQARARYGDLKQADHFTRIINEGQYRRLRGYLDDARERGLEVIELVALDPVRAEAERMIAPTVVLEPGDDARVMQDEIFGPILPIRGYRDHDDAIASRSEERRAGKACIRPG